MAFAVTADGPDDQTDVPSIVRGAIRLGVIEAVFVALIGMGTRLLTGLPEAIICGALLVIGVGAVALLPGLWTRARTLEGIAGAAGIGLGATVVFLLIDVALFQPFGLYTNRWREIGGGSNWWYHPVWWMVGTFLPWMGGLILANQRSKGGVSVGAAMTSTVGFTFLAAAAAVLAGVPRAGWTLGTFGVALLPGITLAAVVSVLRHRRA